MVPWKIDWVHTILAITKANTQYYNSTLLWETWMTKRLSWSQKTQGNIGAFVINRVGSPICIAITWRSRKEDDCNCKPWEEVPFK